MGTRHRIVCFLESDIQCCQDGVLGNGTISNILVHFGKRLHSEEDVHVQCSMWQYTDL